MNILWIQPYFLWPCTTGGKTRQYNLLKQLNTQGHKVTVLCLVKEAPSDEALTEARKVVSDVHWRLRRPLKSLTNLWHTLFSAKPLLATINGVDPSFERLIANMLSQQHWDIVQLEHSYSYDLIRSLYREKPFPFILTEHNVESDMAISVFGKFPSLLKKLFFLERYRYQRWERLAFDTSQHVLAVTHKDAEVFTKISTTPVSVIENGVDCQALQHITAAHGRQRICFLGNFDYFPNIDAAKWIIEDIFPRIREQLPDVELTIFGHNSVVLDSSIPSNKGITRLGFVKELADVYSQNAIFLSPIRHGGGSKLKILEAMAAGLPIVGTHQAFSGLAIDESCAQLYEKAEDLATATVVLLQDPNRANEQANKAREWVRQSHDWATITDRLEKVYQQCLKS